MFVLKVFCDYKKASVVAILKEMCFFCQIDN